MDVNKRDKERIRFLIDREIDPNNVVNFAVSARHQYRMAVLTMKRKYGTRGAYRKAYIRSYLFHKRFIKLNAK